MDVTAPNGGTIRLTYRPDGIEAHAVALPRERLDARLVALATASGAELREGVVVKAPILRDGVVRGIRGSHGGTPVEVEARMTVVADGSRSTLAASLGLTRPVRWPRRLGLVAHAEGVEFPGGYGRMFVDRGGYCGVAPLPDGLANVAIVVPHGALRGSGLSATQFFHVWIAAHPQLRRAVGGAPLVTPIRGVSQIGMRVQRPYAPGAVLVGDAAGFFDPFTGEGIFRALRGAELASTAVMAFLESGSRRPLHDYATARTNAFRSKSAVTALVQLFVQRPALLQYAAPRLGRRAVALQVLGNVLGDTADPWTFLRPAMLWEALRP
jgi:flavin-dependent dehydrogenase